MSRVRFGLLDRLRVAPVEMVQSWPLLPGLAFSVKGGVLGLAWGILTSLGLGLSPWNSLGLSLVSAATASFLAMNFTGATTFTSQTGALLEVDKAVIPQGIGLLAGLLAVGLGLLPGLSG